jgi:large subunit ribosomal protein L24
MASKKKTISKFKKKFKIIQGDNVLVISGNYKGTEGEVISVDRERDRVTVRDVNIISKHQKPTQENPQGGGIIEKEASIHISNVQLLDPTSNEPTKVGRKLNEDGKLQRYSKSTGEFIHGKRKTKR